MNGVDFNAKQAGVALFDRNSKTVQSMHVWSGTTDFDDDHILFP